MVKYSSGQFLYTTSYAIYVYIRDDSFKLICCSFSSYVHSIPNQIHTLLYTVLQVCRIWRFSQAFTEFMRDLTNLYV